MKRKKRYEDGGEIDLTAGMKEAYDNRDFYDPTMEEMKSGEDKPLTMDMGKMRAPTKKAVSKPKPKPRPKKVSDYGSFQARDKAEGVKQADRAGLMSQAQSLGSEYSKMASALKSAPAGAGRDALEKLVSRKKADYEIASAAIPKGYAKGGAVRGSGKAVKGVRKCKIC